MTPLLCRPLIFIAWLFGQRQARHLDRLARERAHDLAVIDDIAAGRWIKNEETP